MGGSDVIYFDGVRFVSAADAAKEFGFVRDYLARLCRQGLVRGRQVGRNWYVDHSALQNFLIEQEHRKQLAHEELRRERRAERVAAQSASHQKLRNAPATGASNNPPSGLQHAIMTAPPGGFSALARAAIERSQTIAHAPLANAFAHTPVYALSPFAEFLHKVIALTLAFMLVFGTYALVDPRSAQFAADSIQSQVDAVRHSGTDLNTLADRAQTQVAAAAEDPGGTLAAASNAVATGIPALLNDLASTFNTRVNDFVYAVAFPADLIRSTGIATDSGSVAVQVVPYPNAVKSDIRAVATTQRPTSPTTIINNYTTVEQALPATLASAGGITSAQLDQKLQQLDNKLSSQMFSLSSANSTAIAQNYQVTAQSNAIDQLDGTAIHNPAITGGSISNADISGGSISGAAIAAGSLSVSGTTGLATTTITGDASVNGDLTVTGNISIPGALTISSSTISLLTATFATTSSFSATDASTTNLTWVNATGTNTILTNATSTNFFATNASTTNATSTNFFAASAHLLLGVIDSLSATFASVANLTATNLVATNSTTTNAVITSLVATNATSTNQYASSLVAVNATTTNLFTTTLDVESLSLGSGLTSNLVPTANKTYDLGSPSFYWRNGYIDTLSVNNISAASTSIGGTASNNFTINSDNATADTEDMSLIFFRGTVVPNALLSWNSAVNAKRFEFNQPLYIQNQSGSTTQPTLTLQGLSGQTGNIFQIASSSGSNVFTVGSDGSVTISTSTITALSSGTTTLTNLSVTNTSTSTFAGGVSVAGNLNFNGALLQNGLPFAGSQWTTSGSNIYYTTGNVGIGTTSPTNKLEVAGNMFLGGNLTATGTLSVAGNATLANATSTNFFSTTASSTNLFSQTASLGSLTLGTALGISSGGSNATSFTTGQPLAFDGTRFVSTSTLSVVYGGTGAASFTPGAVLLGNGSGALSTTTRGNLTETGSSILTITGGTNALLGGGTTIQVAQASGSQPGFLSSADWTAFNNKAGTASPAFTGTASFANVNVTGAASTTLFSAYGPAYFGSTATSTFDSGGNLTLAGTLTANGNTTLTNATTTSLFVESALSSPNATIGALTATSTLAVSNTASFFGTSSFGGTATTSIDSAGNVAVAGTLNVTGNTTLANATSTNLFSTTASSTNLFAQTASLGSLTLGTALGIANGGTATSTQVTNGVNFFDGTRITSGTALVFNGTNLGIGSSTPMSLLSLKGSAPNITLQNTGSSNQLWQLGSGGLSAASGAFTIYDKTNASTKLYVDTGTGSNGEVRIGTSTNVTGNNSKLFVFGGSNGANLDAMGDASITGGDQATFEAEGSDYTGANKSSLALQYYGPNGLGTSLGYTNKRLGILDFGTASTSIISTGINQLGADNPLIFGTGYIQRAVLSGAGNFGIGTTSPYALLSLAGASLGTTPVFSVSTSTASATTTAFLVDQNGNTTIGNNGSVLTINGATTTAAKGINLTAGCFAIGGNCLTLGSFSGTLPIASGGTNATSFSTGQPLAYDGTSFVSTSTLSAVYGGTGVNNGANTITLGGNLTTTPANALTLTTAGATNVSLPTSGTLVNSAVTTLSSLASVGTITSGVWNGTAIDATHGGTAQTSWTTGDMLYASAANTLSKLADVATGNALISGGVGTAPSWGKVSLSTAVSGTLQAAQFPALTGDITTSAGALATTLATVNANTGSFGSSTAIPSFTVNGKGLITAASTNAVVAPAGTLTGTTLASNVVSSSLTSVSTLGSLSVSGLSTLGQASTTLFSSYGPAYFGGSSTSSFSSTGVLTLGTALGIASGGTATTTQVTNGVNFFDGTRITSGTALVFNGTNLGIGTSSPISTFSFADTTNYGSITGTSNKYASYGSYAPQGTLQTSTTAFAGSFAGSQVNVDGSNLTLAGSGDHIVTANLRGQKGSVFGSPTINDGGLGNNFTLSGAGVEGAVSLTPTFGTFDNPTTFNSYGGLFSNSSAPGGTTPTTNAYGIDVSSTGTLGTSATTNHFGGRFTVSGSAVNNYGTRVESVSGATNNYGLYINTVAAAATNYALYSNAAAQSYFAGNVGIGTTNPQQALEITKGATDATPLVLRDTNGGTGYVRQLFTNAFFTDNGSAGLAAIEGLDSGSQGGNLVFMTTNNSGGAGGTPTEKMRIDSSGNVGIGTASPIRPLHIASSNFTEFIIESTSLTNTQAAGRLWGISNGNGDLGIRSGNADLSSNLNDLTIHPNGNATLTGALTQNSDARLKTNIQTLDDQSGLSAIEQLNPVTFNWINPMQATSTQIGFIAQQVQQVLPLLVSTSTATTTWTPDGTLALNYTGLIPPLVKAVQDIANITSTFQKNLIAWLGNASNGIGDLFATAIHATTGDFQTTNATTTNTQQLCITNSPTDPTPLCVTKPQLAALLSAAATSQSTESVTSSAAQNPTPNLPISVTSVAATSSSDSSATPPVLQVNGDNPASIQVGDTYQDLGATITGPQADLNLGIKTFLNEQLVSNIVIDTSAAATDTIDYVATDPSGLTSTSTRTVIIGASPSIVPTDNASTTASTTLQ